MILSETLSLLRELHGPSLERIRVSDAVVGIHFSAIKLSDGSGGMAGTPRPEDGPLPRRKCEVPGELKGEPVLALLEPFVEEVFQRSLAVAAMNALSSPWLDHKRYRVVYDKDALDLVPLHAGMTVTLVGAFPSYIERLKSADGIRLRVLELRESAFHEEDKAYYVPAKEARAVIPDSDVLLITGLTLANETLDEFLGFLRPGTFAVVVGPSGSILPDALFRRDVSMASGCVLTDPDAALKLLSQGACARHLYGRCARKVNLSPL
ncbi:MAG: DUF364 domain-containing protein [Elusimicrobiota bacterium]